MIAREWKCLCPPEHSEGFGAHLAATGVAETSGTPGYLGHQVLTRHVDGMVEWTLVTYWESLESIKAFAGEDIGKAVLYTGDEAYGIVPETVVRHYEVSGAGFPKALP